MIRKKFTLTQPCYFNYELTAIPTSLFKDYAMRKTTKAQLAEVFMTKVQPSECNTQLHHVLDSGTLIHRVKCQKGATYTEIAKSYVSYVCASTSWMQLYNL